MKKILALILALSTLLMCVACTSTKKGANGEVNVMLLETGIGSDFLKELADQFYDETGIVVNVNSDPLIDEDLANSMITGDAQDDIYMSGATYNWIDWVVADTIEDLTDLCNETYDDGSTINSKIKSEIRNLGKIGDHRFIIQLTYCPTGIVYNQDMLDDLYSKGLVDSNVFPTTWTALVKLMKDVSNANYTYNNKKVYGMVWGDTDMDLSDTFKTLWAQGDYDKYKQYFAQEETLDRNLFISDERQKALEALYDLIAPVDGKSSTSVSSMMTATHKEAYNSFLRGDALICFAGSWFKQEVSANLSEDTFNFKFVPIPAMDGNEITTNINYPTEYLFIPKNSPNKENAKLFLKFIFREENLVKMHQTLDTLLAFDYDTSSLNLTSWGQNVQSVLKYKNTVSGSTSLYYLVGALRPEISGSVYQKMYNGSVERNNLQSLLVSDFNSKSGGNWQDKVQAVNSYSTKLKAKGLIN